MGSAAELDAGGRWLLQRVLLAELAKANAPGLVSQARQGLREILQTEIAEEHFQSLLAAQRQQLGGLNVEPDVEWPTPLALRWPG